MSSITAAFADADLDLRLLRNTEHEELIPLISTVFKYIILCKINCLKTHTFAKIVRIGNYVLNRGNRGNICKLCAENHY